MKTNPNEVTKPPNRRLPLYIASKLVTGSPATWLRVVKDAEEDHDFVVRMYHPLRLGLNKEIRTPGSAESAMTLMFSNRRETDTNRSVEEKSFRALQVFRSKFLSQIQALEEDIVGTPCRAVSFRLGEARCEGLFHAILLLKDGTRKLAYYHCSDWKPKQVKAFAELLGLMAESMGYTREDVWFLDLTSGTVLPANGGVQLRRQLISTGDLYARLFRDAA